MAVMSRVVDRVAILSMEAGGDRNEVDADMAAELERAWRRFETDPHLDVAVLTGTTDGFSVGRAIDADEELAPAKPLFGFTNSGLGKPVIAAIEGGCLSEGLELALWCDLRICGSSSIFGFHQRRIQRPLMDGGTQRLPRLVGTGVALEMILTGRQMDAEEAFAVGLVNLVVADGTVGHAAQEVAEQIARFPQGTVRANRQAVLDGSGLALAEGIQMERRLATNAIETRAREVRRGSRQSGHVVSPVRFELPESGTGPAVIFIPDRWGMDEFAVSAVESLLNSGYIVVPLPLFERPYGADEADEAVRRLRNANVAERLRSTVRSARLHPAVDGEVAVIGMGIGGGLALWLSGECPEVTGCVTFGATATWPDLEPDFATSKAAFLGHNGELDDVASPHTAYRLEMAMRDHGLDATFETYRGMEREFYRSERIEDLHMLNQAWARTLTFLRRTL